MCRPLKEIISELEEKYSGYELLYDIEERHRIILEFNNNMDILFTYIKKYGEDVEDLAKHYMNPGGRICQITVDMIVMMHHYCESLVNYDYAIEQYPMNDFYEKNKELLDLFHLNLQNYAKLFNYIYNKKIFSTGLSKEEDLLRKIFYDLEDYKKGINVTPTGMTRLNLIEIQKLKGNDLIYALSIIMQYFERYLIKINKRAVMSDDYRLETVYERNYLLYAKKYWPTEVINFRKHITKHHFRGKNKISVLEILKDDAMRDFEYHTESGKIWRYYSEDKPQMARQMRERSLDEEQWFSFFRGIFEIEEYDRWIEELRNPAESDEDKELRDKLLRSNTILDIQKMQDKGIDILKLYKYIKIHFINDDMKAYLWYALRRFLEKLDILLDCTNVDFEKQMNKSEWFNNVPKPCSDNEMNNYNFLNGKHSSLWLSTDIPAGNRATPSGLRNVYNTYSDLEINVKELME